MAAPVLLVHLYSEKALELILPVLANQQRPAGTVFLGHYGPDIKQAALIKAKGAGALYAPTFHLAPKENPRAKRPVVVPGASSNDPFAGTLPAATQFSVLGNRRLPKNDQRQWGLELGRRLRDQLRQKRHRLEALHKDQPENQRPTMAAWQLDEIYSECRFQNAEGRAYREFTGGVIRGLAEGRKEFGDKVEPGFVWISEKALAQVPHLPDTKDVQDFWADVNFGSKFLVGEEYPEFVGKGTDVGANCGNPHQVLARHSNPDCKELATKYIVGMTPGWKRSPNQLRGNTNHHLSVKELESWRHDFIKGRTTKQKPAGYGQFSFDLDNAEKERIGEAIRSLQFAATQAGS